MTFPINFKLIYVVLSKIFVMRLLLMSVLLVFCVNMNAQDTVYCEIVGRSDVFRKKTVVTLDFGKDYPIEYTENGKPVTFESMVDALNYMNSKGWVFIHAYTINEGGDRAVAQNVYRFLVKKNGNKK